ncbi:unnamed protein product [Ranitomeya imitator]|uniref:G-protein coupled receptors family 1 profile domain-containing protein n=1 Tax=Ranitomeya imitator TaxID=111125 RepID=A0ABN9LB57_9NEOB|nr:unnamed protein product [Ranitomeya imitator]
MKNCGQINRDRNDSEKGSHPWNSDNITCVSLFCSDDNLEWYCYVLIAMCFTCILVGFLGNIIVLISYAYYNKAWKSSTIFLFNLALCDFTWIIILPISIYFSINKLVMFSFPAFCKFKRIIFNINIYGNIFFLMLISFDRYLYSVHPLTSLRWWDKKKAKLCTTAIWLFIFIELTPDIYYILHTKHAIEAVACFDYLEEPMDFVVPLTLSRFAIGFLIPVESFQENGRREVSGDEISVLKSHLPRSCCRDLHLRMRHLRRPFSRKESTEQESMDGAAELPHAAWNREQRQHPTALDRPWHQASVTQHGSITR